MRHFINRYSHLKIHLPDTITDQRQKLPLPVVLDKQFCVMLQTCKGYADQVRAL